jgi:hypothetical protein
MRGGSQAHLLAASDGKAYVTKLTNNPQRIRSVISEAFCHALLSNFSVCIPAARPVLVTQDFIARHPGFGLEDAKGLRPAVPGLHFGSLYPGECNRDAVYDYLPSSLFGQVENRLDFAAILVFDIWVMQADQRQAIFVRERFRTGRRLARRRNLRAYMVDHGMAFGGVSWDFLNGPRTQTLQCPAAYETVQGPETLEPWLTAVERFPEASVWESIRKIPDCWLSGNFGELEAVAERLIERRKLVRLEILSLIRRSAERFPNWRSAGVSIHSGHRQEQRPVLSEQQTSQCGAEQSFHLANPFSERETAWEGGQPVFQPPGICAGRTENSTVQ